MNHYVAFGDQELIAAYESVMGTIQHTDAPSELELCNIRTKICPNAEIVSLHWLRNRLVQLRKGGKLKRQTEPDLFSGTKP